MAHSTKWRSSRWASVFGLGDELPSGSEEHDNFHLRDRRVDRSRRKSLTRCLPGGLQADRWLVQLSLSTWSETERVDVNGGRIAVIGAGPALVNALTQSIERRGATAIRFSATSMPSSSNRDCWRALMSLRVCWVSSMPVSLRCSIIFWVGSEAFTQKLHEASRRWFAIARGVYRRLESLGRKGFFAGITAMGGDFGLTSDGGMFRRGDCRVSQGPQASAEGGGEGG